jgi:hypothetical protein
MNRLLTPGSIVVIVGTIGLAVTILRSLQAIDPPARRQELAVFAVGALIIFVFGVAMVLAERSAHNRQR